MESLFGDSNLQKAKVAREMASSYMQIAQHEATTEGATAEATARDRSNKIATTASMRQRERRLTPKLSPASKSWAGRRSAPQEDGAFELRCESIRC